LLQDYKTCYNEETEDIVIWPEVYTLVK
jgi:hypothetical protein